MCLPCGFQLISCSCLLLPIYHRDFHFQFAYSNLKYHQNYSPCFAFRCPNECKYSEKKIIPLYPEVASLNSDANSSPDWTLHSKQTQQFALPEIVRPEIIFIQMEEGYRHIVPNYPTIYSPDLSGIVAVPLSCPTEYKGRNDILTILIFELHEEYAFISAIALSAYPNSFDVCLSNVSQNS
ncbi:hypothetical protein T07_6718 [Trichinella nelsoni]|uniref:Uncharacterized protein n=1 Tax=Trichinella nelsoni TaxID=6336 RepID=A0A0V0S6E2_9BILA|nr:hypothetical protein T07_6718 [Trichinella nelsoni]